MTGIDDDWPVLVPVEVLEGETVSEAVIDLLSTLPVVLLGYHVLPDQTPPGQARMQFEDRAQARLDDLAAAFHAAGGAAETRLVFTGEEDQTLDRVADETGCEAILVPNPAGTIDRVLVSMHEGTDARRVAAFVAALVGDRDIGVTVLHVAESEGAVEAGRAVIDDAVARLREAGLPDDAIGTDIAVSGTPVRALGSAADDHDAVITGESEPSLRSLLLGETADRIAAQSLGPVIVVRRPRDVEPAD